ncbi:MAG: DUF4314 domain-containing protein [Oscillospiraceae bacterium]|nr:DUF4314 domain-containing protein [Oscillospiraceae bacterium]
MDKIFDLELSNECGRYSYLQLPTTDYEFLDALERLGMDADTQPKWEICDSLNYDYLRGVIQNTDSLYEVNDLCRRLDRMNATDHAAFEGLFRMRLLRNDAPSVSDLITMANSTESCQVLADAVNDEQLGRFYAEEGFCPELEKLPNNIFEKLDFAKIGREMRLAEGGVFLRNAYVVQTDDLIPAQSIQSLEHPDYAVLLEVSAGPFDPIYDTDTPTAHLKLPASRKQMDAVLNEVNAASWEEVSLRCLDCRVPSLIEALSDTEHMDSPSTWAEQLAALNDQELATYKALLKTVDCKDLKTAALLLPTLDQYLLSPHLTSCYDIAKAELMTTMDRDAASLLIPYVDLYRYGKALQQQRNQEITDYGVIERRDGQSISFAVEELLKKEEMRMNSLKHAQQMARYYKEQYPPGSRIEVTVMRDDPRPIAPGTRGTVNFVDDIGTVHCTFDNGRQLGVCPGKDSFHLVQDQRQVQEQEAQMEQEVQEQQEEQMQEQSNDTPELQMSGISM